MNISVKNSLRAQLTIWTFMAVLLLTTIMLIISSYRSYSLFLDDYQETLSERMKYVASSLTSMIKETNYLGMSRQANSLLLTYGVVGVKVIDANGQPIIIKGDTKGFELHHPIIDENRHLGLVQVNFSKIPIREKARRLILDILIITLFTVPLTALAMWFLCGWKLKDIVNLSRELHQVGDLKSEDINLSGINRQDEIGHLARSLAARSKAIQAGLEQQQLLARAIDQSHDSIVITNNQGTIEYVNPAFSRITGYSYQEAIGQNPRIVKSGKHPVKFYEIMWQTLTSGQTWHGRIINRRKNGTEYQEEATISPVFDDKKQIHHYVAVKRDVTEETILKEQLSQAQKMEAIGVMAGGIAHDLNNILTGTVAYPDLLLPQLSPDSPMRKPLQEIKESGRRAADIVADLLTIARGIAAARETTSINDLVRDYLGSPEHKKFSSSHQHVSFSTSLQPDLHPIPCSPVHIRKCIMNLTINGAEAIKGTGTVYISTSNQQIDNPITQNQYVEKGLYSVLTIQDNGTGIDPIDIDRIFEPFYTKKHMGRSGTGLGLAVVWNTVQDHAGYITVGSSNQGTRFDLYFPATSHQNLPQYNRNQAKLAKGNGQHILIVDDEPQIRDIVSKTLEECHYSVASVDNGEEALEYLSHTAVDLVLLDMIMGDGMNGKQTYEQILKKYPGQKALIISGFSQDSEVKQTLELGADGFIHKPFDIVELATIVYKILNQTKS